MNERLPGPTCCVRCNAEMTLPVARYTGDEGVRQFLEQERETPTCAGCGSRLDLELPCAVFRQGWVGVVLANPAPYLVSLAGADALRIVGDSSPNGGRIIVVGRSDQLKRILRLSSNQWLNAIRFDSLVGRAWWPELEGLRILVDACLKADRPERAYWLIIETIGFANELYFCPDVSRMLRVVAQRAGNRIAPGLKDPKTASDDLRRVQGILEPLRTPVPEWYDRAYLAFFDGDDFFRSGGRMDYSMLVEQVRLDPAGQPDFGGAERHIDLYPLQAIAQAVPSLLERLMVQMCVIGLTPGIQDLLSTLDRNDALALQSFKDGFRNLWTKAIGASDRYELYKKYREVSGGRDLVSDFSLPPEGIYLTIDRMESSVDPRF